MINDVNTTVRLAAVKVVMALAVDMPEETIKIVPTLLSDASATTETVAGSEEVYLAILNNLSKLRGASQESIKTELVPG